MADSEIIAEFKLLVEKLELELKTKDAQLALYKANTEEIIQAHAAFRDFVDESARHIRLLIVEYGRQLMVLEVQQAQYGLEVPPRIIIQIQDIRTKIEELRAKIRSNKAHTDFLISENGKFYDT